MKLIKAEIINYRSIKHQTVLFDPTCRVLVGINESGKSNVLRALSLLNPENHPVRGDDARESLPSEPEVNEALVRFFFRLDQTESNELSSEVIGSLLTTDIDPQMLKVNGKQESLSDFVARYYDVRHVVNILDETRAYRYPTIPKNHLLMPGWVKPKAGFPNDFVTEHDGEEVSINKFELIKKTDYDDIPDAWVEPATTADFEKVMGKAIIRVAERHAIPVISWSYDEKYLLPALISIDEFGARPETCIPLMNMFKLAGIDDIASEIFRLRGMTPNRAQNLLDRIAKKTTAHFLSVWKEYKDIEFSLRLDSDKIIPGIKEENSFDFAKRSDGFKRFVTFLLMISVGVKTEELNNQLLLIDEPDIGLHPSGARYLKEELISISTKNFVVYSTHSIFMIDTGNISRHYIVRKKKETTTLEIAAESNLADEEVLYNALGFSVFEILKQRNFIFEGWKDKQLFLSALGKAPPAVKAALKDVGVCHAKGAKSIRAITPIIELANRSYLVLSDSDVPAKEQQRQFLSDNASGIWMIYQEVDPTLTAITGEDFVKNSAIVSAVNTICSASGLPVMKVEDLPQDCAKLAAILAWLKANGFDNDNAKDTLTAIKNLISKDLEPRHIEDSYQNFLKGLATYTKSMT